MDKNGYKTNFPWEKPDGGDNPPDWSEQERAALRGDIPMTQGLFERCLDACAKAGNFPEFARLFERFPDCGKVWAATQHKKLKAVAADLKSRGFEITASAEDIQARWTAYREDVRKALGDEIADSIAEDVFSAS